MDTVETVKMVDPVVQGTNELNVIYLYKEYETDHPLNDLNAIPNWKQLLREAFAYFKASFKTVYPKAAMITCDVTNPFNEFLAARTSVYAKARLAHRGNMIFTDTDVLPYFALPKDFWDGDWDIALTRIHDDWPLMPFNEGIFFARDTVGAQKFMDTYTKAACNTAVGLMTFPTSWWIGQLALGHAFTMHHGRGVNFKILRDSKYNFIPNQLVATNAYFIHFKGGRKSLMKQYLAGLLGTDYISIKDLENIR